MSLGLTADMRPVKRSFTIKGHRTSISLEAPFWAALREAAAAQDTTLAGLVAAIDARRGQAGLSSAVRVWVLDYYRAHAEATDAPGDR
jgi:predicted DNA-binding ribbon-helix-helix protein